MKKNFSKSVALWHTFPSWFSCPSYIKSILTHSHLQLIVCLFQHAMTIISISCSLFIISFHILIQIILGLKFKYDWIWLCRVKSTRVVFDFWIFNIIQSRKQVINRFSFEGTFVLGLKVGHSSIYTCSSNVVLSHLKRAIWNF